MPANSRWDLIQRWKGERISFSSPSSRCWQCLSSIKRRVVHRKHDGCRCASGCCVWVAHTCDDVLRPSWRSYVKKDLDLCRVQSCGGVFGSKRDLWQAYKWPRRDLAWQVGRTGDVSINCLHVIESAWRLFFSTAFVLFCFRRKDMVIIVVCKKWTFVNKNATSCVLEQFLILFKSILCWKLSLWLKCEFWDPVYLHQQTGP